MMKKIIVTMLALLVLLPAFAQTRKVSGVVRDENGDVLAGAIVVVKSGSENGPVSSTVTTDTKGRYTTECKDKDYISFHYLGYTDAVYPVKSSKVIDVTLMPDANTVLEDVVVIGYGAVKKEDLTGSVTNVKMGDIRDNPVLSIDQALQGRVAGMVITSTDGEPGSDAVIRIRGTRSITASNDPLIVVDGVMDAVGSLNDVNPADIEAISVLKDASATAIYGARGANGVIIITTKGSTDSNQGSQNIAITLHSSVGISMLPRNLDLMNSEQFGIYRNEYFQHAGLNTAKYNANTPLSGLSVKTPFTNGPGTDWIADVSRVAPYQHHWISMNGFAGKQKFYASLGYGDEQGILQQSGRQNYTGTLNVTNNVFKWLTLYTNLRYQYRTQDNNLTSIGSGGIYYGAQYLSPLINPSDSYNPMNNTSTNIDNAVVRLKELTDHTDRSMLTITAGANVRLAAPLKYKTKVSYYFFDRQRYKYSPSTLPSRTDAMGGYARRENYGEQSLYFEQTAEYSREWGRHHMDVTAGQTFKHFTSHSFNLEGEGYVVDAMKWNNMSAVQDKSSYGAGTDKTVKDKMAFFARANYNYRKRYYLTLTGRLDGASNFAANHKWGFFPSGAFKWKISNEPWLRAEWLDDLSLKVSLGQSGNDINKAYRSLARMDGGSGGYPFNGSYSQEYWQARIAAPNLTWETTTEGNIALDAAFFNNRLSASLEAYRAVTTDLLLTVKIPQHTGYDNKYQNIGRTTSQGIDFSIDSRNVVTRNFSWSTAFTISHNSSVVNDIGAETEVSSRTAPTRGYMIVGYKVGYPVNAFWGFQYAGVWHNQEEVERNKITHSYVNEASSSKLGYPIYIDQNHDGTLNASDIVFLGSPDPIVSGGLQNTFRIKGLSIGIYLSYQIGGKVLNYPELYMAGSRRTNQFAYMVNAWHPEKNPNSNLPRAGIFDSDAVPSSFIIHDASYLRLKNVSIGYRFNLKSKLFRELELSLSGENLYLWTNYNGFDPDVSSGGVNGYDVSAYPKPLRIVFTAQVKY